MESKKIITKKNCNTSVSVTNYNLPKTFTFLFGGLTKKTFINNSFLHILLSVKALKQYI
jgi:hypothetical protein